MDAAPPNSLLCSPHHDIVARAISPEGKEDDHDDPRQGAKDEHEYYVKRHVGAGTCLAPRERIGLFTRRVLLVLVLTLVALGGIGTIYQAAKCVNCLLCWLQCPDSAILLEGTQFEGFDYDYCKGCEICAEHVPYERDLDGRWVG